MAKILVVFPDAPTLAETVSSRWLETIAAACQEHEHVHVSLTGGSMGIAVLAAAAKNPLRETINWSQVHLWWSDERFVEKDSSERNANQANDALLSQLTIPAENIHEIAATDEYESPEAAATAYTAQLMKYGTEEHPLPVFDISLLGVGPDAHIASLFPGRDEITHQGAEAIAVRDSPKPPPNRVTMTRPLINASKRIWMVISGAEKATALQQIVDGTSYLQAPAAGAEGTQQTVILSEQSAAASLNFEHCTVELATDFPT